jgi:hypothetical protein
MEGTKPSIRQETRGIKLKNLSVLQEIYNAFVLKKGKGIFMYTKILQLLKTEVYLV